MKKVLIIAEAGVNHNGNIDIAKKLVDSAKESGADVVKFQTFKPEKIVTQNASKAKYQQENTHINESQKSMLSKLALSNDDFIELKQYCEAVGISFLSTPFDIESIEFLNEIGCRYWKIPSGEVTNYPYLVKIAQTKKPVIMSTGMCDFNEINDAIETLEKFGTKKITLLHCNTMYPTPFEDVNLNAMNALTKKFNCPIGYSDHTEGIEVPIAAVAIGATVVEKHFTLDRKMQGPDHKASLEPPELKQMIDSIRNIEKALGSEKKEVTASELPNREVARKSIVAAKYIKAGEVLSEENITTKRPGSGISPMKWNDIIGTKAIRDFEEDEMIELL